MSAPREKIPWPAVARLIEDRLESNKAVQLDDLLVAHGVDSLDAYELGYAIEEQFDVSFTDSEIAGWRTFRNVLDMARAKAGDAPIPQPDRLARHAEAGSGDADKGWLIAEVKRLRAYLSEISLGRGAYSHDHLEHADNCIRDMKAQAVKALQGDPWEDA